MATDVNFGTQQYFGFDPRTIGGVGLWFDAADSSTVTLNGTNVSAWADKSSNAYTVSQTTAAAQPAYTQNLLNGRPGVVAGGSAVYQLSNVSVSTANLFESGANFTTFQVMNLTAPPTSDNTSPLAMEGASRRYIQFGFGPSASYRYAFDAGVPASPRATTTAATMFGSNVLFSASRSATTTFQMKVNATVITTATIGTTTNLITDSSLVLRVIYQSSGSFIPVMNLFEIIHYNRALTLAETQQVEGYLAWKWGLTTNLPTSHPFKKNPPAMRLFQPTDVLPCQLWLDAADGSTVSTPVTSAITQWRDKSGNGNNTTSIGAATYASNVAAFNNLNCVSNITNLAGPITASGTTELTMIVIGSVPALSSTYWNALALNSSVKATAVANFYAAGNAFFSYYGGNPNVYGYSAGNMSLSTPITYGQPFLWIGQVSGATTNTWGSGTFYGSSTVTSATYTYSGYWVGGPDPVAAWPGNIGEIIVYGSNISTSDRQQLEGYLAWKWGLRGNLPTTHPFYKFPPSIPITNPLILSGLTLWLDAADSTTITATVTISYNSFVTATATTVPFVGTLSSVANLTGGTVIMNGAQIGVPSGSTPVSGLWAPSATSGRWYSYVIEGGYCKTVLCEFVLTGATLTVRGISAGYTPTVANYLSSASPGATNDTRYGTYFTATIATSSTSTGYGVQSFVMNTTGTNGIITSWNDKSGNGYNMTPYSTYGTAQVSSAYQNGLDVLSCAGRTVYKTPASSAVYPLDVYIVIALKTITRCDPFAMGSTTSDNFNGLTLGEYTLRRWHNGSTNFNRTPLTVAPADETSTSFLIMNWTLAQNSFIIRRNGVTLSTANYTFTMTSGSIFQMGYRQTWTAAAPTPDTDMGAYIAEIVVYNSQLAASQRWKVEGYLAWKWGLQNNLATTHPYYKFRP